MEMLANKKVYIGKFGKEIIEKAERLGFKKGTYDFDRMPFLIFDGVSKKMIGLYYIDSFNNHLSTEVTPEWILSLPEPIKDVRKEKGVRGFYIDNQGKVSKKNYLYNPIEMKHFRFFSTESVAQAWAKLPELLYWRDKYNEGWIADFRRPDYKHVIKCHKDIPAPEDGRSYNEILAFKSREIRNKFLNDFKELIDICKPLL